jgi:hypothetical protein
MIRLRLGKQRLRRFALALGSAGKGKDVISRSVAVHTIQPLLSALAVEAKFAPTLLEPAMLKKVAVRIFDALPQSAKCLIINSSE